MKREASFGIFANMAAFYVERAGIIPSGKIHRLVMRKLFLAIPKWQICWRREFAKNYRFRTRQVSCVRAQALTPSRTLAAYRFST